MTLVKWEEGPEYDHCLVPAEVELMVKSIREVEAKKLGLVPSLPSVSQQCCLF